MSKIIGDEKQKEIQNTNNRASSKSINLGIEILRAYMCFSIVILHFLKKKYNTYYLTIFIFHCQPFYVPTFFLISFYFSFNTFVSKNIPKIKERFIRIFIPYTVWPIFLWFRKIIINYKDINFDYRLFKAIFFQLLIGYDFYSVYWFLFDLIFITFIITIIAFIFKNYSLIILKIIGIIFYIINKKYEGILDKYKRKGSIKPLLGSFIYSLTGFLLGSKLIIKKLKNKRYIIFILIIPVIFLIYIHKILIKISRRFKIIVVDIVVICLFIIFSLTPFENLKNNITKKFIKQITSYTGGIYYLHYAVRQIFSTYFKIFNVRDFTSCIINYLTCYIICFIGTNIFRKNKLRYLFL